MVAPGLDKHEWESWWQQFEEDVETSPAEALSELDRLTVEMLEARGYALDDPVAREGDDRDIIAEYVAAHETTEAVEQGKDVSREDIDAAIDGIARCTTICWPSAAHRRFRTPAQNRHRSVRQLSVSSTARVVGVSPHPGGGVGEGLGSAHDAG
jgi:hypothetical protein